MTEYLSRIESFLTSLKTHSQVWVLANDNALLMTCANNDEQQDLLPVWVDSESAQAQCHGEWAQFKVVSFTQNEFCDLLEQLAEDEVLIGIDQTAEQVAIEITAKSLLEQI